MLKYRKTINNSSNLNYKPIITIIFSLATLFGLSQNIPGPLIPIFIEEFNIGYDQIGLIFFIGLFFGMISATIFGRLSDKLGRKPVINLGIGFLSCGILGIIFSNSAIFFALSYCIMNLGFGTLEAGITTGAAELGENNRSFILTGFSKFGSLGSFIGPLILFIIIYFNLWWRILFILLFITLVIVFFLFLKVNYPKKQYHRKHTNISFKDIINPVIITGALVLIFHNGVIITFGAWLTTYFSIFKISIGYSSIIVSFYWLSILLGRILTQRIIQIINEKRFLIIVGFATTVALAIIAFSGNIVIKIIFSFLLGLFIAGIFPLLLSILFSTNPKIIGGIFSLLGFVGYGSVMIFQFIIGYFAENYGEETIIYVQFASSVLCFIFILLMTRFKSILDKDLKSLS